MTLSITMTMTVMIMIMMALMMIMRERVVCVRHGDPTEMTCGQGDTTALQSTGDHCTALRCIAVH